MKSLKVFLTVLLIAFGVMVIAPNISRAEMMKDDKGMMGDMKDKGMMGDIKENSKAETAISGYCPVCVIHGMPMKGSNHFITEYNGKLYKFSNIEMQKAFVNNPEEYTKGLEDKFQVIKK